MKLAFLKRLNGVECFRVVYNFVNDGFKKTLKKRGVPCVCHQDVTV